MNEDKKVKTILTDVKEHERRLILLNNKVKWLQKELTANRLLTKALMTRQEECFKK